MDASAPTPRALPAALVEAGRVLAVAGLLGLASGTVRGVPDEAAIVGDAPATCGAPVDARPEIAWIELDEARGLADDPAVLFVDARAADAFASGHVAGAVHVPMETGTLDPHALAWVRGARTVITYCDTDGDCASSRRLALLLSDGGIADVRVLRGGMPAWLSSGAPAEAGPCRVCP